MSKEYVVIKSARSSRRYRAKGYTLQAWRISSWLSAPRRSLLVDKEEQQLIREIAEKKYQGWEVRAYPPADVKDDVKDEDKLFNFFFSDHTPGCNPKSLNLAAPFHEGVRLPRKSFSVAAKQKLRAMSVGSKLEDWDGSYIVRIK